MTVAAAPPAQPAAGSTMPEPLRGLGPVEQAWALKAQCYAAWSSEPQATSKAADALDDLQASTATAALPRTQRDEIGALAAWARGIAAMAAGDLVQALSAFDRATEGFLTLGRDDVAAQTQVPKVASLAMLGRYDEAIACADEALQRFKAHGDALGAAKINLNLGALHERRGTYAQAVRHLREATVRFARLGDHQHSVMTDIDLAMALGATGAFDEAMHVAARARERALRHGYPVLRALADEAGARMHLARGEHSQALSGFETARRGFEALGMLQQQAVVEKQLADTYLELRLLPESLALFDGVLERLEAQKLDDQAWAMAQRGRVLALMDRLEPARDAFDAAALLFERQGNRVGEAAVALARAEVMLLSGDTAGATAWSERARAAYEAAGAADGCARAELVKAQSLFEAGSVEIARAHFESILDKARRLVLQTIQVRCLTGLGLCALALGDEAYALDAFEAAIEGLEIQRRALPGDELRHAFLADHLQPYRERLRLALRDHARAPTRAKAAAVLMQLERMRARTLGERIDDTASADGVVDDQATRELRDRCQWLARQVQRQQETGQAAAGLMETLRRCEHELLEHARRARLTTQHAAARPTDSSFTPEALCDALAADEAVIEYGVLDDELLACVVTRTGVTLHRRIASWRQVDEACRATRFQLEALRHGAGPLREHLPMLAARAQRRLQVVYEHVFEPLAPDLRTCRRLLIVPCGALASLPFAALGDGQTALVERFDLAISPSARQALHGARQAGRRPGRGLEAWGESGSLAHAAREARLVAGLVDDGRAWVGEQATIANWHLHAPPAGVLHLACHAQYRGDNPMFSALHLHDGPLTVEGVQATRLDASLVVLSACETGVSDTGSGEESVGLVRAFLVAGASRVLASLWPVDDRVTASFMEAFYAARERGAGPALALRLAQIEIKASHPHPFYWSAFALHGGW